MSETKIVVDEELVKQYARVKNVSLEEARQKLEENMIKEGEVDLRQKYQVLINSFRKMQPQLQGLVFRESDVTNSIAQLRNEVARLSKSNQELMERLDFERETYKKSMKLLNGIVAEDEKTQARISALEAKEVPSLPLYKRILNRIKCLLNS